MSISSTLVTFEAALIQCFSNTSLAGLGQVAGPTNGADWLGSPVATLGAARNGNTVSSRPVNGSTLGVEFKLTPVSTPDSANVRLNSDFASAAESKPT